MPPAIGDECGALPDTTALIDLGRPVRDMSHQRVRAAVHQLLAAGETLFTSRICEAEFRVGPEMSRDRTSELQRVDRVLAGLVVLEFDAQAAVLYAVIKAALLRRGRPIGDCDTLIAAIALSNGQSLLTRNPRHFDPVTGLVVKAY